MSKLKLWYGKNWATFWTWGFTFGCVIAICLLILLLLHIKQGH